MEIPLNAQVECTDGVYGRSVSVLVNPVTDAVTHLVVRANSAPHKESMVRVDLVDQTIAETILLHCSKADLEKMDPFIVTRYIENRGPAKNFPYISQYAPGGVYYTPIDTPETSIYIPVEEEQVPPGELAIYRGTRVEAADGYIGQVDEFVVNPENSHVTHLVMREEHLWGKKDVIIPISAIDKTLADTIYLKLDKRQVESLPTFPLHRRWE